MQLLSAALVGAALKVHLENLGRPDGSALATPICLLLMVYGGWLHLRWRRAPLGELSKILKYSSEIPVLYLRPFFTAGIDTLNAVGGTFWGLWRAFFAGPEERLLNRLWRIGHVMTVARPGEPLPPLGTVHVGIPDDEWRQRVADYIERAEIVAIRISESDNLMWEIQTAAHSKDPSRLLLWFPPEDTWGDWRELGSWSEIRIQLQSALKISVPETLDRNSYLYFDDARNLVVSNTFKTFLERHQRRRWSALEISRRVQWFVMLIGFGLGVLYGEKWYLWLKMHA